MAKQKKNSNYVTDKTIARKAQKEEEIKKEKQSKTIKTVAISVGATLVSVAIIIGILFACGAFDYSARATSHAGIEIEDYGTLHVELYGNDAPTTVEHFISLSKGGYFNGMSLHTYEDGLLYGGAKSAEDIKRGIKGEFLANGIDNKVKIEKGVIVMARGEDPDSAYGQFFIVTDDKVEGIQGNYAAFGKVTDLKMLDKIIASLEGEDGLLSVDDALKIVKIDLHESH